jgi:membrane-associated phospholipid phosphatase
MNTWRLITALGDAAVILPLSLIVALALAFRSAPLAKSWALLILCVGVVVAGSKLLNMIWGLSVSGLAFSGLSGHAALAMVFWPLVLPLCASALKDWLRVLGVASGCALAVLIAVSRVAVRAHSVSEVVLGAAFGLAMGGFFLWCHWRRWRIEHASVPLVFALLGCMLLTYGARFPSTSILKWIASSFQSWQ